MIEPMISGQPYPIKGLIAYGTGLFHTLPNVPRTKEALKNLDFYMAIDTLPQDHVAWADVVLPEAMYLERYDELWVCAHQTPYIALREPAVEPYAETKPAWWIARELGLRLGLEDFFTWQDAEEYLNRRLSSIGLTLDKLRQQDGIAVQTGKPWLEDYEKDGTSPFATETGKVELFAQSLEKSNIKPLPEYEPTAAGPAGFFRLLYGRSPVHTFSRTQNTPVLNALVPENEIWVNDEVAAQLGLKQGDRVMLENQDGAKSGPLAVKATPRIRKDCVYMVHGFGHDAPGLTRANKRGASDAALQTRYALDPICGGAGLRINFVKLAAVQEEA
ncbi:MAG: molybdopterin-dependent oxidoreductase [Chloroflexi bacterium]|nr:molybdopterin-dependent oxidoreductase [Chloroflexota bacterium]